MNEFDRTRAKILGVLIRDARMHDGRTIEDCAQVIEMPAEQFEKVEYGEANISLPQLETLAMYLKVPLNHFWGDKTMGDYLRTNYTDLIVDRQEEIGRRLNQAREEANRTTQDLAMEIKVPPSRIDAYEQGNEPIPLFHLERISRYLGHSLRYFMDESEDSLLSEHEAEQKLTQRFNDLPPEMQEFVTEPVNISYLDIALRLSKMDVHALRTVAENILNITF